MIFSGIVAHANTVEYVSLKVTSDQVPAGENTNIVSSRELEVSGGRIQGYRMPFITGEDHRVTIIGHLTDMLDRVEITEGGTVVRTIRKSSLVSCGHTDDHGGKGKIVFDLNSRDLPGSGDDFQIRIRFSVEMAGHDKLDCKVVKRGTIERAEWSTANNAVLPEFNTTSTGRPADDLTRNGVYTLRFVCFKCPESIQVGDGITKELLQQDVISTSLINGRIMKDTIVATFRATEALGSIDRLDFVRFCDAGVGNIRGGWGKYVDCRIRKPLPARSAGTPLVSDLELVRTRGFGGGGSGGGVAIGIGTSRGTPDPAAQPDITVSLTNAFTSGATFTAEDASRYNFCQNLPDQQQTRSTIILPLTIKVQNVGTANITTPFTVAISGGGNSNFFADRVETIPTLQAGEIYQIIVSRKQSVVCARRSATACTRCPENLGGNGIVHWNDRGTTVTVDNGGVITEANEGNNTASVPR